MYRIIRTSGSLDHLERLVSLAQAEDWNVSGGPFRDEPTLLWCQAMTRSAPAATTGKVQIREPKKATA